jgi:hypothetical protein
MFFNGDPDPNRKGRCPAGNMHEAHGFVFYLPHDVPETVGQPGWRFCHKCFGMFFNGDPDPNRKGRCPAGNMHEAHGFLFVLPRDVPETVGQPGWRFCHKCFGMFFNGDLDPNRKGRCPAGNMHEAHGSLFVLPHRAFPSASIALDAIQDGQRLIEVTGSGFEPNQRVSITHRVRLFPSDTFQQGDVPREVRSNSEGRIFDRIPIGGAISRATVGAFDFGSGETAIQRLNGGV